MVKILLKIVAQDHLVVEKEADSVSLETIDGQITILPNHVPLVAQLKPGEAVIKNNNIEEFLAIAGGFVEVGSNKVLVLANQVERVEEIDIDRAEEAKKRAEQKLLEMKDKETVEYTHFAAKLEKELLRIKVARKRRSTHSNQTMN